MPGRLEPGILQFQKSGWNYGLMPTCWTWIWTQAMHCKKAYGRQLDQKQPLVSCYVMILNPALLQHQHPVVLTYLWAKCQGEAKRDRMSQWQRKEYRDIKRKLRVKKEEESVVLLHIYPEQKGLHSCSLLRWRSVIWCDFAHSCIWSVRHTYSSGFERRLHLLVLQFLPVHVAKEAVLPDVSLALWTAAQPLCWMLRHQLDTKGRRDMISAQCVPLSAVPVFSIFILTS